MSEAVEPRHLSEERLEILRLVENQTITAEEASRLLEALDRSDRAERVGREGREDHFTAPFPPGFPFTPPPPPRGGRSVRIRITDTSEDQTKLNLVLPHPLLEAGLKMAKRFAPDQMLEAKEIRETIDEGFTGSILDILDGDQRVEIILEGAEPLSRRELRRLERRER
jgi:hypothetical protein